MLRPFVFAGVDSCRNGGRGVVNRSYALVLALVLTLAAPAVNGQEPGVGMSAGDAMRRVVAATGATPPVGIVDTLKAGDPDTPVTGIATTFMDTYAVLQKAVASGKNLIITHEPTFYDHPDDKTWADDPVYQQKLRYIEEHHLVVWRFHDTWHLREPDGILEGVVEEFGWKGYQNKDNPHRFTLAPTTVAAIAEQLRAKTGAARIRIVGDPNLRVTGVALLPGASGEEKQVKALEEDSVQLLVAGEAREWETVPYVQDAAAEGRRKALILLGHEVSEEAGMKECARWVKTLFPGVPVEFIPTGEPFAGSNGTRRPALSR